MRTHGVDTNAQGVVNKERLYQLLRQSHEVKDRTFEIELSGRAGLCLLPSDEARERSSVWTHRTRPRGCPQLALSGRANRADECPL
jgi:hypothetical protein